MVDPSGDQTGKFPAEKDKGACSEEFRGGKKIPYGEREKGWSEGSAKWAAI